MTDETLPPETEVETGSETPEKEKRAKPELMIIARHLARAIWLADYKEAHPEATAQEAGEAWKPLRNQHSKTVLRALKGMERRGYVFAAPPAEVAAEAAED